MTTQSTSTTRRVFAALIAVLVQPAAADVLITEIMYNPQGSDRQTGQFNKEWVEIYNAGLAPIDLGGWTLEDLQDNSVSAALPAGTLLGVGEALVLTGDATTLDAAWGPGINRLELANFPTLANSPSATNETVAIRDNFNVIRDAVNYDDQGAWPRDDGSDGASIALRPEALSASLNDSGASWLPAMAGVYGAYFTDDELLGENHGSPGIVDTVVQQPFTPSVDAAWSMVVVPDVQNYAKSSVNKPILTEITEWIRDNRSTWNIQVALQEGDLVNNNDAVELTSGDQPSDQQWQNAKSGFAILDGEVPYILATGNHDYGTTSAQNRSTQFNTFFSASDNPLVDPSVGGVLQGFQQAGELQNAYYELTAPDGRELLVVSLEWGPRQQVVAWANQIVGQSKYDDHTAILLTHAYMYHDESRYDWGRNTDADPDNDQDGNPYAYGTADNTNDGEDLWDELVKLHENFEFVLSGHVGGDGLGYLASEGDHGNVVHQMLFNSQFEPHGGNGWLRVFEFLDDGRSVRVRTFSPHHNLQRTDAANDILLQISPPLPLAADFDGDGDVDAQDRQQWEAMLGTTGFVGAGAIQWQREFAGLGAAAPTATTTPEPWSSGLIAAAALGVTLIGPRRRTAAQ